MTESATLRPLTEEDIPTVMAMAKRALDGVGQALDAQAEPPAPDTPEALARRADRYRHAIKHDPDGSWVADLDGEPVGVGLSIRREGLWMLSLLAVTDGMQGKGLGAQLLEKALWTSAGSTSGLIVSSRDPRAMRRYHQAGFRLEPAYSAKGTLDRSLIPADLGVRDGDLDRDLDLCEDIARARRGSAHGPDLAFLVRHGDSLFVAEDNRHRGFALAHDGDPVIVAADSAPLAARLAWACLATAPDGGRVRLGMMTARQAWAIDVAMDARLTLKMGVSIASRGATGPFTPYLPSGSFG